MQKSLNLTVSESVLIIISNVTTFIGLYFLVLAAFKVGFWIAFGLTHFILMGLIFYFFDIYGEICTRDFFKFYLFLIIDAIFVYFCVSSNDLKSFTLFYPACSFFPSLLWALCLGKAKADTSGLTKFEKVKKYIVPIIVTLLIVTLFVLLTIKGGIIRAQVIEDYLY